MQCNAVKLPLSIGERREGRDSRAGWQQGGQGWVAAGRAGLEVAVRTAGQGGSKEGRAGWQQGGQGWPLVNT